MQTQIYVGGCNWIVDENTLINWLSQNAVRVGEKTRMVHEIIEDDKQGRVILNEKC